MHFEAQMTRRSEPHCQHVPRAARHLPHLVQILGARGEGNKAAFARLYQSVHTVGITKGKQPAREVGAIVREVEER